MGTRIVQVDAHRGASVSFPENTLIAFESAIASGADSVEFDVQLSADGAPVVIHDDTVDRTTDGSGEVAALNLEELRALDAGSWKAPSFAGEKIPTLDETLELLGHMIRINMELKTADPRLADLAIEALQRQSLLWNATVSSFHLDHLRRAKDLTADVRTSLILDSEPPEGFWSDQGGVVDAVAVHVDHATADVLAAMAEVDRPVSVWTVDDPHRAVELAANGVSIIPTNDPLTILDALGEAGLRGSRPDDGS